MQQCGMIALKSREDSCILPHFEVFATVIVLYSLSLQVTYVQAVFRSTHGQSWSETMCSKCSHPCRTTIFNYRKHKVATHTGHNKHAFQVEVGCKRHPTGLPQLSINPRLMTYSRRIKKNQRDNCPAFSSSKRTNQYKHGCDVKLNIPEKQLRFWTECKSSNGNRD